VLVTLCYKKLIPTGGGVDETRRDETRREAVFWIVPETKAMF
jgi:hypothetical protein